MSIKPLYFQIKFFNFLLIINFRSTEIKQTIKKYQSEDDITSEDFEDQDNIILSLGNSRKSEVSKLSFKNITFRSNLNQIWIFRSLKF